MSKSLGHRTLTNQFRSTQFRFGRPHSQSKEKRPKSVSSKKQDYEKSLAEYNIMNSIRKAVKANDVTLLLGNRREKLRTQISNKQDQKQIIVHQELIQIRKKYDDVKRQRVHKFNQNQKLKQKLKTIQVCEFQQRSNIEKTKQRNGSIDEKLNFYKHAIQQVTMQKKILLSMKDRLSKDIVYYKNKYNVNQRVYIQSKKQINNLQKQHKTLVNEAQNTVILMSKLQDQLRFQQVDREEQLNNFEEKIINKRKQLQEKYDWDDFKDQTAIETLQAKDEQQKNWQKLLLTHLFLKHILKQKIVFQMHKFSLVEKAFETIKSRTETKDTQEFVYKYLNRDQLYGELLSDVSDCKKKFEQLKIQHQKLIQSNSKLEDIQKQIENMVYISYQNHFDQQQQRRIMEWNQRVKKLEQAKIIICEWVTRQILKLGKVYKKWTYQPTKTVPKTNSQLKDRFMQYLMRLNQAIDEINQQKQTMQTIEADNQIYYEQYRNQCQVQQQLPINLANSSQIYNTSKVYTNVPGPTLKKRKQSQSYRIQDESVNIQNQRELLIIKNQKFMKDARMRLLQGKRLKVDKEIQPKKP